MDSIDSYRALAAYNRWMNERLYGLCAELDEDERTRELGAFFGSIHGTLNHILLADRIWLGRFTGDRERFASRDAGGQLIEVRGLDQILYDDFAELRAQRAATDGAIETWVASLDGARLAQPLSYASSSGRHEHPLWWAVSHFFNHQTHHRGQVTTLLVQLGRDPGVTDLIAFLRSA